MQTPELLFLKPYCREVIWGGTKLKELYGYETGGDHTGEAWVVSANEEQQSLVTRGSFAGRGLWELWQERRDLFGNLPGEKFPLLVKVIDANEHLSIQVHPDDPYARIHENGALGKTECWYVLDCDEDADIVIGHTAATPDELERMVAREEWEQLIQVLPLAKGDFFFVPAGTVHAIRKGTLLLEIQQNSDVTYRLYDYDRLQDGQPRELHLQQSLDMITCPHRPQATAGAVRHEDGYSHQRLVSNAQFTVEKWDVHTELTLPQPHSFMTVSVLAGEGAVNGESLRRGDHFVAPYGCGDLHFEGQLSLITSHM